MDKQRVCTNNGWESRKFDGQKTRTILPSGFLGLDIIMIAFAVIVIVVVLSANGIQLPTM